MNRMIKMTFAGLLCAGLATAGVARAQEKATEETYRKAAQFQFGKSRSDLAAIEAEIRSASKDQYPQIEARLIEMLRSPGMTTDARRYVCRYLGLVGSGRAVEELAPLLTDERASHPARMALEAIADPAAGKALVAALDRTQGKLLAGIIGSVGARREASAVQQLAKFTNDSEEVVAAAAIAALGQIGTPEAARALDHAASAATEPLKRNVMRAQITCAHRLAAAGSDDEARRIFTKLTGEDYPLAQRCAAYQGLIAVSPPREAVQQIADLIQRQEPRLQATALAAFKDAKDDQVRRGVVAHLPNLNPRARIALIGLLNDFPNVPARNPLLAIVQSAGDEQLRKAAIECLAVHGEVGDVPMLVKLATGGQSDAEKNAAKSALANLGKPGTDETLIKLIDSVEPPARAVVIGALSARHSKQALPVLVKLTSGSDQQAATEAIAALGEIGTPQELKTLLAIIVNSGDDKLRGAAERAAGNLCARVADPAATSRVLVPAYGEAKAAPAKVALLKLMPRARGEQALTAVTNATGEADETVRDAAVRVLTSWPEGSAIPVLFQFLDKNDNPTHRILALQGITRLAGQQELGEQKRIDALRQVLEKAQRNEEKKAALAALGNVRSVAAVELLGKYADDPALATDAAQAAIRATRELRGGNREKAEAVLETFKSKQIGDDLKKRIEEVQNDEGGQRRRRR